MERLQPVLLSSAAEISQLLEKLEEDFGDSSLQVRCAILLAKRYPMKTFQIWVDVWPDFTTVLLKKKLSENLNYHYNVFASIGDNLKKMLEESDILEWKEQVFTAIPRQCNQIIKNAANKQGFDTIQSDESFTFYKFNPRKFKDRPIPNDVTVGSLNENYAEQVLKDWGHQLMFNEISLSVIKYFITNYPTVCIYDSKGCNPVAYAIVQAHGGLGMLYVEPTHRNRGLGKLVMNLLVQKYMDSVGCSTFIAVSKGNEASVKLHVDLGFEQTDTAIGWIRVF